MNVGTLTAKMGVDMSGFIAGFRQASETLKHTGAEMQAARGMAAGLGQSMHGAAGAAEGMAGALRGLGEIAAFAGLTLGAKEFGRAIIEAAGKSEDGAQNIRNGFGAAGGAVIAWSDATADAMNRSRAEVRGFVGDFQAILGPTVGAAAGEMSKTLAQLTIDFAAFKNISDESAFEALRSGLLGRDMELKRLGVSLNQTRLDAIAMAMGFGVAFDKLSEGDKETVRFKAIVESLAPALGAAAKSTNDLGEATKRLAASWEEFKAHLGGAILPALAKEMSQLSYIMQEWSRAGEWQDKGGAAQFHAPINAESPEARATAMATLHAQYMHQRADSMAAALESNTKLVPDAAERAGAAAKAASEAVARAAKSEADFEDEQANRFNLAIEAADKAREASAAAAALANANSAVAMLGQVGAQMGEQISGTAAKIGSALGEVAAAVASGGDALALAGAGIEAGILALGWDLGTRLGTWLGHKIWGTEKERMDAILAQGDSGHDLPSGTGDTATMYKAVRDAPGSRALADAKQAQADYYRGLASTSTGGQAKLYSEAADDYQAAADAARKLANAAGSAADSLLNMPEGFKVALAGARFDATAAVPGHAAGGIVMRPHFAMVGESGPEAIIPLNKAGSLGNTINATIVSDSAERVWRELKRIMERDGMARNGSTFRNPGSRFLPPF